MAQEILLVEDSADDAFMISRTIEKNLNGRFKVTHRASMAAAQEYMQKNKDSVGLILLDLGLPDTTGGRDTYERMRKCAPELPVVILTGLEDHGLAVALVREGAEDYV